MSSVRPRSATAMCMMTGLTPRGMAARLLAMTHATLAGGVRRHTACSRSRPLGDTVTSVPGPELPCWLGKARR
eukprot:7275665-Prorocentrum_lima.AAC.1